MNAKQTKTETVFSKKLPGWAVELIQIGVALLLSAGAALLLLAYG